MKSEDAYYENFYKDGKGGNFLVSFTNVWDTMNGMCGWKAKTGWGLFFYMVLTIFINIGMLNIVISVVSDIYEKVMTTKH